jgi:hypothetical protein
VITTNDDTLSAEALALGYQQLMRVEECWRVMKSGLRTRPVFPWRPDRITAHFGLCVLALRLERVAERRSGDTWRNLLATLETIQVVAYERSGVRVRQTTEIQPRALQLLKKLGIPPPPRLHEVRAAPAAAEEHAPQPTKRRNFFASSASRLPRPPLVCQSRVQILAFFVDFASLRRLLAHLDVAPRQPEPLAHAPPDDAQDLRAHA